jgi:hypothetical protein
MKIYIINETVLFEHNEIIVTVSFIVSIHKVNGLFSFIEIEVALSSSMH